MRTSVGGDLPLAKATDVDGKRGVSRGKLQRFLKEEDPQDLKLTDLELLYKAVEKWCREKGNSVRATHQETVSRLFSKPAAIVRLADIVGLNDLEQREFADKFEGTFLLIRRSRSGSFFLATVSVRDTFLSLGLPTFELRRRTSSGLSELRVGGVCFEKNRKVFLIGRSESEGEIVSTNIISQDRYNVFHGLTSGFESAANAFSSPCILVRAKEEKKLSDGLSFADLQLKTGLIPDRETVLRFLHDYSDYDPELVFPPNFFEGSSYLSIGLVDE